jgi:hypothetical protein
MKTNWTLKLHIFFNLYDKGEEFNFSIVNSPYLCTYEEAHPGIFQRGVSTIKVGGVPLLFLVFKGGSTLKLRYFYPMLTKFSDEKGEGSDPRNPPLDPPMLCKAHALMYLYISTDLTCKIRLLHMISFWVEAGYRFMVQGLLQFPAESTFYKLHVYGCY